VNVLIDVLKSLRYQGQETIFVSEKNFAFLKTGPNLDPNQMTSFPTVEIENHSQNNLVAHETVRSGLKLSDNNKQIPIMSPSSASVSRKNFSSKREHWEDLKMRVLGNEELKKHIRPGKNLVFGVGNLDAEIFFCGEAPGADEEIQGIPFVGRAGQLLTKIIIAMGLSREEVYIGNIMNWRPEMDTEMGNRPPTQEEMQFCLPYLIEQLEIVQPKVIVALGATAVSGILGYDRNRKMSSIRGKWHEFCGIPLMITFHPSYLLRNGTRQMKRIVWEDMLQVMEKIGMSISEKQRKYFLER
jgi:DNA polymerase